MQVNKFSSFVSPANFRKGEGMGSYLFKNVAKARCMGLMATKTGRVFGGVFKKICPVPRPATYALQKAQSKRLKKLLESK